MPRRAYRPPAWLFDASFLAALSLFYGWWAFEGLAEQGIYCDIGLLAWKALVPIAGIDMGADPHFVTAFGRSYPLMLLDYHGPAEIYFAIPWIRLLGHTALALHVGPVLLGMATIPLFYALQLAIYRSRLAAAVNSALLFSSVSYIVGCRLGLYTGTLLIFLALAAAFCFLRWDRTDRPVWAVAGFFWIGIGLGSRIFFVWFALAAALFAWRSGLLGKLRLLNRRRALLCAAAMLVGVLPVLVANVQEPLFSLRFLAGHAVVSSDGVSNLRYPANLLERLRHVWLLWRGDAYSVGRNPLNAALLAAAWAIGLWRLWKGRGKTSAGAWSRLPFWAVGVTLLLSPLTPSGFQALHLYVAYPFFFFMPGAVAAAFESRWRRGGRIALAVLIGAVVARNASLFLYERAHQQIHGGHDVRWNGLAAVADWLRDRGVRSVALGDTGLTDPLRYLTGMEVGIKEIFWAPYLKVDRAMIESALLERLRAEKEGYYLFRPKEIGWIDYHDRFLELAAASGKRVTAKKEFLAENGRRLFVLYRIGRPVTP